MDQVQVLTSQRATSNYLYMLSTYPLNTNWLEAITTSSSEPVSVLELPLSQDFFPNTCYERLLMQH